MAYLNPVQNYSFLTPVTEGLGKWFIPANGHPRRDPIRTANGHRSAWGSPKALGLLFLRVPDATVKNRASDIQLPSGHPGRRVVTTRPLCGGRPAHGGHGVAGDVHRGQ